MEEMLWIRTPIITLFPRYTCVAVEIVFEFSTYTEDGTVQPPGNRTRYSCFDCRRTSKEAYIEAKRL